MPRTQMNVRLTDEDRALLARLRERTGLDSTGLVRYALRAMAREAALAPGAAPETRECVGGCTDTSEAAGDALAVSQ